MRALILLPQTYADGGIQRFNRTFLAACERLEMQCDVLSLNDSEAGAARWPRPANATVRVFQHDRIRFSAAVARAVWSGSHDAVLIGHINLLVLTVSILSLRWMRRPRSLLVTHGVEVWQGIGGLRRRALGCVDRILSVSEFTRGSIRAQAPELGEERVVVFPNALSESWVAAEGDSLRELPVQQPCSGRFILSVARLDRHDRRKGVVTTIEALAMLADRDVHYVVAGGGDDMDFLKTVAARCGVGARVHFLGAVSDYMLAGLYRHCAAFVLPSGQEGFGIVFLEAMYFGAPVIAAREKGATEVVRDGETGLLVRYGDVVGLAAAIDRLLADDPLRARLREAALGTVVGEGRFTFQSFTKRCAEAFGTRRRDPLPASGHSSHG